LYLVEFQRRLGALARMVTAQAEMDALRRAAKQRIHAQMK
jgi:hypothetical protein